MTNKIEKKSTMTAAQRLENYLPRYLKDTVFPYIRGDWDLDDIEVYFALSKALDTHLIDIKAHLLSEQQRIDQQLQDLNERQSLISLKLHELDSSSDLLTKKVQVTNLLENNTQTEIGARPTPYIPTSGVINKAKQSGFDDKNNQPIPEGVVVKIVKDPILLDSLKKSIGTTDKYKLTDLNDDSEWKIDSVEENLVFNNRVWCTCITSSPLWDVDTESDFKPEQLILIQE